MGCFREKWDYIFWNDSKREIKNARNVLAHFLSKQSDWFRNSGLGIRKMVWWAGTKGQIII